MSDIILAVDLGAGSLRAGAVTLRGRVVAATARPLAASEPRPGWSEIDAELWWRALAAAIGTVLGKLPRAAHVAGLCIAGLTRSQIFLDASGDPLRPAILFRDRRAAAGADEASRYFAAENPAEAITAFHPLARLAWLARVEPALFDRIAGVAEPKDYLNARLTGRLVGDSVTYSRFDALAAVRPLPPALQRCFRCGHCRPLCSAASISSPSSAWRRGRRSVPSPAARRPSTGLPACRSSPARWMPGRARWGPARCGRIRPMTSPASPSRRIISMRG